MLLAHGVEVGIVWERIERAKTEAKIGAAGFRCESTNHPRTAVSKMILFNAVHVLNP